MTKGQYIILLIGMTIVQMGVFILALQYNGFNGAWPVAAGFLAAVGYNSAFLYGRYTKTQDFKEALALAREAVDMLNEDEDE